MTRIAVVSDTHIPMTRPIVPQSILAAVTGADLILHAGDICCAQVLSELERLAPLAAVHGNVDPPDLQAKLPAARVVEWAGIRIGLTHGHIGKCSTTPDRALEIFGNVEGLNLIVFGHSHMPLLERHEGILLFNPGSAMQPRVQSHPSIGLIEVEGGRISASHMFLR
jgi:putative phosphoesterase